MKTNTFIKVLFHLIGTPLLIVAIGIVFGEPADYNMNIGEIMIPKIFAASFGYLYYRVSLKVYPGWTEPDESKEA